MRDLHRTIIGRSLRGDHRQIGTDNKPPALIVSERKTHPAAGCLQGGRIGQIANLCLCQRRMQIKHRRTRMATKARFDQALGG